VSRPVLILKLNIEKIKIETTYFARVVKRALLGDKGKSFPFEFCTYLGRRASFIF